MNQILPLAVLLGISLTLRGQFSETISTDRPCQSIGALTVGKHVLQLQQGVDFANERDHAGDRTSLETNSWIFNNVIRYGLGRKFEINAAIDYQWLNTRLKLEQDSLNYNSNAISAFDFGARYNILEGKNGGPAWCVQARLGFADYVQKNVLPDDEVGLVITTSLAQNINEYQSVTVNLGSNSFDNIFYTLNFALSITPKFGWAIENYGNYAFSQFLDNEFRTYFDTGFWYVLNNDVLIDVQGGYGRNKGYYYFNNEPEPVLSTFFIGAGISWRVGGNG